MGAAEIISLAGVAVALAGAIVLAFRAMGSRVDEVRRETKADIGAVDDRHEEGSKLVHERISAWSDKFVTKEEHRTRMGEISAQMVRLEMLLANHGDRSEKSQEALASRVERALSEQAALLREIDGHTRQRMGGLEQRLAVHEALSTRGTEAKP